MRSWLRENRLPIGAFLVALVVYGAVAGDRLRRRSTDPHFVVQADAWLHGKLSIDQWPAGADDPAKVDEVRLDDGRVVRGRKLQTRQTFRIAGEGEVPASRVKETLRTISYNSFPPFPSVLLIPQVLIHGPWANDVALTIGLAALIPALLLVLFRRLRRAGLHARPPSDEVWLALLLTFGSVLFFSSVQGRVWFTAQVVGCLLTVLYLLAVQDAAHPVLAGLLLGCAVATRPPMLFLGLLFLHEWWRTRSGVRRLVLFAVPVALIGAALVWYNLARFGEPTEFGHSYLVVRQQAQMERYGLFNLHYLGRNLAVALTLLPDFSTRPPYVSISGHGLALWVTSPALLLLLWPRERGAWHRPLWATVGCIAAFTLLYQNSGWIQFGYRFSNDFAVFLFALIAIGERRFGALFWTLGLVAVLVNGFGAVTFQRGPYNRFYFVDGTQKILHQPD
jgi:hypothetical protein